MSHRDRLASYVERFGCQLVEDCDRTALTGVECIVAGGKIGRCDLSVAVDPETKKLLGVPQHAPHCVEVKFHDKCVPTGGDSERNDLQGRLLQG